MSTAEASTRHAFTPRRRDRSANSTQDVAISPSSTTISESGVSTSFHQTGTLPVLVHPPAGFTATRRITIRSDPALLTCFDAADKQLYDLWVPRA